MSVPLPDSILGLRNCLASGEIAARDAIDRQFQDFARLGSATFAAVSCLPKPDQLPQASAPLAGVGLAHKDIFNLAGRRPGLGRDRGTKDPDVVTATAIARLEGAGAITLGTLAMAEDACSATAHTENLPTPINPLGASLAVGGSSSGSAVAVASGMAYASLGTDTAGSVRMPAMTCGVMGLKTTHGLIPREGMTLLCPSLDSIGILARSTADIAAVAHVVAPDLKFTQALPIKTGFWLENTDIDEEVAAVVAPVMRAYGSRHVDIGDHVREASVLQELIMAYEVGQTHARRIADGQACREVQGLGSYGLAIAPGWWQQALKLRPEKLKTFIDQVFGDLDVLFAPLQTAALPKCGEVYSGYSGFKPAKLLGLHRYCGWVNYLGLPSLAMPIGLDSNGLPVSMQLIAKPFHEPQLLAIGKQIETDIFGAQGIKPVTMIEGQLT